MGTGPAVTASQRWCGAQLPPGDTDDAVRAHRAQAWVLLVGAILLAGAAQGLYAGAGVAPGGRYELLVRVGLLVLLWNWYVAQRRPKPPAQIPDPGLFIGLLWPG